MFVITNRMAVAEGHEEDFEKRFKERAKLIDGRKGFIQLRVLKPVRKRFNHKTGKIEESPDRGVYQIQTVWEDEKSFWDWTGSEEFRDAHKDRPPAEMFTAPNAMEMHEVIQEA